MIAILGEKHSSRNHFLACLPRNLTREEFIAASGAKGGLALQLVKRIYETLTVATLNLAEEYQRFYNVEYGSFEQFLYWKYDIDARVLEQIGECSLEDAYLGLGRLYAGGDNVGWLIEGDNPPAALEAAVTILRKLRRGGSDEV